MGHKESRAENAIRRVSELNELVYALREAGRRGREERAAKRAVVREAAGGYHGDDEDGTEG